MEIEILRVPVDRLPVLIWAWDDAPLELQAVSDNGGDEDFLVEFPPRWDDEYSMAAFLQKLEVCGHGLFPHPSKPGWTIGITWHA